MDALTLPHMAHGSATAKARLNVRAEPSAGAPILGVLVASELVTVWALADGWAIVQNVSGLTGWAAAEYLELSELVA